MSGLDEDIDSLQALYIHVLTLTPPLKKERLMAEKNKITQQKKKKRRLGLTNIGFRHPSLTKQYFLHGEIGSTIRLEQRVSQTSIAVKELHVFASAFCLSSTNHHPTPPHITKHEKNVGPRVPGPVRMRA